MEIARGLVGFLLQSMRPPAEANPVVELPVLTREEDHRLGTFLNHRPAVVAILHPVLEMGRSCRCPSQESLVDETLRHLQRTKRVLQPVEGKRQQNSKYGVC